MGSAPDLVGREIAGRYRIVKKLGEGGMGAVYRGEQISLKRAVAVKLLKPELGTNQMVLRRFNAEAEAVAKLSHPNTVNIYDFGQDTDGALFIAMEFIDGRSLRQAIQTEGPFTPTRAISIALQVAASLSDAHAHSIVHRDLKPDNVMLQDRGKHKDVVRVLDFGIAKLRDDSRATQQAMTQAGDMLGTPQYMAPEQIRGEAIDGRTDIYALGCMIYEMLTARLPFEAPTIMAMLSKHLLEAIVPPSQRRPDLMIPPAVDQIVLAAMAKDPAGRPATMDLFSEQLQALLQVLPADPNRSAGMSVQQGIVTPPALSAFQPPTTPPPVGPPPVGPAFTPAPPSAAAFAPTPPPGSYAPGPAPGMLQPARASAKNRLPLYIVLGMLVIGGAGVGVWAAMRESDDAGQGSADPSQPDPWQTPAPAPADPDDPPEDPPDPDEPDPDKPDPWAAEGGGGVSAPAPKPGKIGTAETPIPAGAKLRVSSSFTSTVQADAHLHVDPARNIMIALAPLYAGTNNPTKLGQRWAKETGVTVTGSMKIKSAGKQRDALGFAGALPDGTPVNQVIVLYLEPGYRLGVLYQAPTAMFADEAFQRDVMSFFAKSVVLP